MLIWGMATRVDFQRALVYSRCARRAPHVTRTSWTEVAETQSVRKQPTFNLEADLSENALKCLNAVVCDPGSRGRLQSC